MTRFLTNIAIALLLVSCTASLPPASVETTSANEGECVVLVHGLARSSASMQPLNKALIEHGYQTVNLSYASRDFTVEQLSEKTITEGLQTCREAGAHQIHFVTHSMGGILVRYFLETASDPESDTDFGHLVMLAPPNHGTSIVDVFADTPGAAWFLGPAGMELGEGPDSIPAQLGPVPIDTAVIAGSSTINLILSQFLTNPDDGKVSVSSTRVDGMCAHLTLPVSHPFIMKNTTVIANVLSYLNSGRFLSESAEYPSCNWQQDGYEE